MAKSTWYKHHRKARELEYTRTKDRQNMRKHYKDKAIEIASQCLKECALAETATAAGKKQEASYAIFNADATCQEAKRFAEESRMPGDTKPNAAEKASSNAQKQFEITVKKIQEIQNEIVPTNQDKGFGIT